MILLTGGSGLLGQEIQKYIKCDAPTHKELDITKDITPKKYELIIHAAAYTDVTKAETDNECLNVNIMGTYNLVKAYPNTPIVYISTEYVNNPVNRYTYTKVIAEAVVKTSKYLIIRTLFKPKPFPYDKAFHDQFTNGDYVDVITPLIVDAIKRWNRKISKTIDLGTGRKTILELARQTRPNIKSISIDDIKDVRLPKDYES